LFNWYITLVMLNLIGFSGDYASNLKHRKIAEVEKVPWATELE